MRDLAAPPRERPILFSGEMVCALLDGSKTQTRRVVKLPHSNPLGRWEPVTLGGEKGGRMRDGRTLPEHRAIWHTRTGDAIACPYGFRGDRLWVREAHRLTVCECEETCRVSGNVWFEADASGYKNVSQNRLRPSIHMPRWASRITLEITDVRVERLQAITPNDALAEGCPEFFREDGADPAEPRLWYRAAWNRINGARGFGWDANPYVWIIDFRRIGT
jgi:hypothetical protein